jgi:hypothetical protein
MGPLQLGRAIGRILPSDKTGQWLPALIKDVRRLLNAASVRAIFGSPESFEVGVEPDNKVLALPTFPDVAVPRDLR